MNITHNGVATLGHLCDSNTTARLRAATIEEHDESIYAGAEGHILAVSYRVAPEGCTDADRFDRAGKGKWFATEQEAIDAASLLDAMCPIEDGEWSVYRVEHRAYVED